MSLLAMVRGQCFLNKRQFNVTVTCLDRLFAVGFASNISGEKQEKEMTDTQWRKS